MPILSIATGTAAHCAGALVGEPGHSVRYLLRCFKRKVVVPVRELFEVRAIERARNPTFWVSDDSLRNVSLFCCAEGPAELYIQRRRPARPPPIRVTREGPTPLEPICDPVTGVYPRTLLIVGT